TPRAHPRRTSRSERRSCVVTKESGRPCAAIAKATGEPCRVLVYADGETLCAFHSRTSEQQRNAQAAQVRKLRTKKRGPAAILQDVSETKALDTAAKLLNGVPLDSPDSVRNFLGRRKITHAGTVIGL